MPELFQALIQAADLHGLDIDVGDMDLKPVWSIIWPWETLTLIWCECGSVRAFYSQRLFQTPTETAGAQAPLSPLGQTDGLANFPALFRIARMLQTEYETSLYLFAVCYYWGSMRWVLLFYLTIFFIWLLFFDLMFRGMWFDCVCVFLLCACRIH